jgi:putative transposase
MELVCEKNFTRTILEKQQEARASLAQCCRLFGISSQVVYQRMHHHRLGTRKLYYLLTDLLEQHQLRIIRGGLFDLLKAQEILIKPKKNYTKTTNSNHWLRKHANLIKEVQPQSLDETYVSVIT